MNRVKKVEFIFENCESFEIESKYFGGFQVSDITTSVFRIACNSISKMTTAHTIAFEIFSEGNDQYNPFGNSENTRKFDRIEAWRDITSIVLFYDDGTHESYYVDYDEEVEGALGAENLNQHTYLSALGNLYIVIAKGKDVFDFFDKEEIESEESINFSKTMISE